MNKKQRERHKQNVKEFMEKKKEFNKIHPDEYEAKQLIHKKAKDKKLEKKDKKRLRKLWREKKRKIRKEYKEGKITKTEMKTKLKKLEKFKD